MIASGDQLRLSRFPTPVATSKVYDCVRCDYELTAPSPVVVRLGAESVFVTDFRADADQIVEPMRETDGPACVGGSKAAPLALFVIQEIDGTERQEIVLGDLERRVVNDSDGW